MCNLFNRWRRKLGCVTLVLSCVFTIAWIRSSTIEDRITLNACRYAQDSLLSCQHGLAWISSRVSDRSKGKAYLDYTDIDYSQFIGKRLVFGFNPKNFDMTLYCGAGCRYQFYPSQA